MERKGIKELKRKYVKGLLEWFYEHNKGRNWKVEAMKALFRLTKQWGSGVFIPISKLPGIPPAAVERWVETGVVENEAEGCSAYRIRPVFYESTQQALIEYDREHA